MNKVIIFDGAIAGVARIWTQDCEYIKTADGMPALNLKWEKFIGTRNAVFIFSIEADSIELISPELTQQKMKKLGVISGAARGSSFGLVGAAFGAMLASHSNNDTELRGLRVEYRSPKQNKGYFLMAAIPSVIDEIIASFPPDKIVGVSK